MSRITGIRTIRIGERPNLLWVEITTDEGLTGLVRKYYIFDEASHTGGGVYLWESREAARAVYTADWIKTVTERYGAPPEISYFESPVIVDNATSPKAQAAE